jgi:hypothetical protein
MGTKALIGARTIGGLLAVILVAGACSHADTAAVKVRTGTSAPADTTTSATAAPDTTAVPVATTAGAAPARSPRSAVRRAGPGAPSAAALGQPGAAALSKLDTGLTRIRVTFDSQADWAQLGLDGTEILASQIIETTGGARVTSLGPQISIAHPGRAVIDFVLKIAPDANPAMSMCKNYKGPATITLTRLTDAAATVGSLANDGANPTAENGCENPAHGSLSRASLIGPVRWPARTDGRPLVLANYYPWYGPDNAGADYGDNPTGPVDTINPDVVSAAMNLAATHGIDGWIVEYEATPAFDSRIDTVFALADARKNFFSALTVDLDILNTRNNGINDQTLDSAFNAVASRANHASQLRVNGQPVVFVYRADKVDPGRWRSALDRLRSRTGIALFVVADDPRLGSQGRYLYSTNNLGDLPSLLRWAADTVLNLRAGPGLTGNAGPLWVAPVSPGYDDRRLGRRNPQFVDRAAGQRYTDSWHGGVASLPDWVVITSWNEYYEQTHVMPGTTTGTRALEQTATFAAEFHATG